MPDASGSAATIEPVFGGSFDPPHLGHLEMIRYVLGLPEVDRIVLVPAGLSPFKQDRPPTSGEHRLRMIRLALEAELDEAQRARCVVETGELERPGPSFTVDTLLELSRRDSTRSGPPRIRVLLVGADAVRGFERWKEPDRILATHALWVFRRPGDDPSETARLCRQLSERFPGPPHRLLENPPVDCSSTEIRGALHAGRPAGACLPGSVLDYILAHRLYAKDGAVSR